MTSLASTQAQSAMYGPIGCCRRNVNPHLARFRSAFHRSRSATVRSRRRRRARSTRVTRTLADGVNGRRSDRMDCRVVSIGRRRRRIEVLRIRGAGRGNVGRPLWAGRVNVRRPSRAGRVNVRQPSPSAVRLPPLDSLRSLGTAAHGSSLSRARERGWERGWEKGWTHAALASIEPVKPSNPIKPSL